VRADPPGPPAKPIAKTALAARGRRRGYNQTDLQMESAHVARPWFSHQFCDGITRRDALTSALRPYSVRGSRCQPARVGEGPRRGAQAVRRGEERHRDLPARRRTHTGHVGSEAERAGGDSRRVQADQTTVPGIQICEHVPQTALWMHKMALLRSVNHKAGCHNTLPSFTGSEQPVDVERTDPARELPARDGRGVRIAQARGHRPAALRRPADGARWGFALDRPGPHGRASSARSATRCGAPRSPKIDPKPPTGRRPMWLGEPKLADTNSRPT